MTRSRSASLVLRLSFLGALAPQGAYAITPVEYQTLQEQVATDMEQLTKTEVTAVFTKLGLRVPQVSVVTRATLSEDADGHTGVASLAIDAQVTTDEPANIVREARDSIARALTDRGYQVGAAAIAPATDGKPRAELIVRAVPPPPEALKKNSTREYAVFAAIVLALLASLILFVVLLLSPWRRRRRAFHQLPVVAASGVPDLGLEALPALTDADLADEQKIFAEEAEEPAVEAVALDPEAEALRQMPFEKVLDVLIATDPKDRRDMIAKLGLNPPLRARLEQELT